MCSTEAELRTTPGRQQAVQRTTARTEHAVTSVAVVPPEKRRRRPGVGKEIKE